MGFVAAYLRAQVGLVIFRDLAGYGGGAGPHDGVDQVAAHGVRHVTGCGVHQGLSRIGDGSISCAVDDITGRSVLDIFGIGCYGLIRCRVRDAAFRPSGEDVVSKCGLHVGGIDENFVGTDLICHAGRACVGDGSSVICEDLARCHVGNTGVIHHALHCRTVADLRRHRLTGRAGDGLCLIRHRFSSLIGNRPGIIRDGAIRSEVADIAIRGRIGDTLCSRIRQVLSCIGNRTICRHVGNVAICRSIGDVIRGCIGNCVAGRVDELVGIVRDGAVLGRIRQIRRGLRRRRGVFAVLDLAGDVIRFLVELRILRVTRVDLVENLADVLLEGRTQALFVGEDTAAFRGTLRCSVLVVIRIDSGGRDAISLYRQIALLPAIVCSRRFCPSGRAVCIVIKRTFLLAAVFGVRGFLIACDFTSCDFRAGRDVVVANDAILRQVDFINVEFALDRQIAADFCIAFCHQFAANLSIARCLQRSCLHSTSRLDGAAACIETFNSCVSCFQCAFDFSVAIYSCISGSMKSSSFHSSCGLDSSCAHIQSSAGNLAAADSAGTYIQALASDVPGHSKVAAYCRIMMDGQCIGNCITGIGQTVGRECSAYRCIAGSSQGTEGAGSAINGSAGNGSCRNDIMSIDVAGCSQISILERSYTVCQFISGDSTGSGQVRHTGDCTCGRDFHIADFAVCCCDFAICIHGELAICALDGAISLESCLCLISCITAGIKTVFVHDSTIQAHFDALIAQGNLVVPIFIQDHFCDVGLLGSYIAIVIDVGGVFLENVVIAQADATVHSFRQFLISTDAGCFFRCVSICAGLGFIGIRLVQSRKAVGHIGVDGIEPVHHILVNLFNDFILGFISTDAGSCFIIQALSQCSHIFADFLIRFHDTGILYRCISLAHIILGSLVFQIFFHIGNPGVQFLIAGFDFIMDSVGFVRNAIIQSIIGFLPGYSFIGICLVQGSESISHVLVDSVDACYQVIINLLNHLVLGCICAKASSRFLCQGGVQVGHVFADGLVVFYDGPILNCSVCLAYIVLVGFTQHVLFYIGNTSIKLRNSIRIGFNLCIQAPQVFPYRIVLFDISSVFGSLIGHTVRSYFTCYSYITRRSDTTGRNASGSQFSTDFHIFDCLIFFSAYN